MGVAAYAIDRQFVQLSLTIGSDRKEEREQAPEFQSKDLREILRHAGKYPSLVRLGRPGAGQSTLLRRLQMDQCIEAIRTRSDLVSIFVPLKSGPSAMPDPMGWLAEQWKTDYPYPRAGESTIPRSSRRWAAGPGRGVHQTSGQFFMS